MAQTSQLVPTNNSGSWSNPTNAYANGGGNATSLTSSQQHLYYDFDILSEVPAGAQIDGIQVILDAFTSNDFWSNQIQAQLSHNGGTNYTSNKSTGNLSESETTYNLGGSSDTWGRTWNTSELTDGNFRVRITHTDSDIDVNISLDFIRIIVYYTVLSTDTNSERAAKITGVYEQKQSQSVAIATPATPITKAVLMPDTTEPSDSSIDWYMSADGGSNWEAVTPNAEHVFTNQGQDLRWRAIHNPSTDGFSFPTIQKVVVSWELGESADDERSAKITGQEASNSERSAKITGVAEQANDERSAKISGQEASNNERDIRMYGGYTFSVNDDFSTTDNKDVANTTAQWTGNGEVTL